MGLFRRRKERKRKEKIAKVSDYPDLDAVEYRIPKENASKELSELSTPGYAGVGQFPWNVKEIEKILVEDFREKGSPKLFYRDSWMSHVLWDVNDFVKPRFLVVVKDEGEAYKVVVKRMKEKEGLAETIKKIRKLLESR